MAIARSRDPALLVALKVVDRAQSVRLRDVRLDWATGAMRVSLTSFWLVGLQRAGAATGIVVASPLGPPLFAAWASGRLARRGSPAPSAV